ncbi:arylsulfatase [Thalassotalea euphylliae]|uniref:Arylsulfatase n=1 Tax=Thalassotalea euphylliae TaxID=1655234 RepID=A0A3E0TUY9_9GAMM|nr:arylsulfatase [Thalassotalea euphylliae]REL28270.1 arylsulfatase [Thalassotalea euphylliae]
MRLSSALLAVLLASSIIGCSPKVSEKQSEENQSIPATSVKPNLVIFYIDDLGYGDVGAYGAKGVETPNIDQLANNGFKLTDAHSSAATCTPSRYSLLTGEHGFRSNASILPGDAPALIRPGKATLPSMLKKAGYETAVVGKWHLGLGDGNVDWNGDVSPGPLDIGFDYSFLLPATGDRVPTVYLENRNVVGLDKSDPIQVSYKEKVGDRPTRKERPDLARVVADEQHSDTIINGVSRIGTMAGGESALWKDEDFPDIFTEKAVNFIRQNKDKPFFLFHSYHDIHVPRLPHPRFQGKSSMGPRGDAIVQMDWMTGQVVKELEQLGIAENTIIVFTSDNGPVLTDGYDDMAIEMLGEHKPAGPFRGGKYSAYEAGTRVPTIIYWPNTIAPKESDDLFSQMDIYASMAKLLDIQLEDGEAMDSVENLDFMLGMAPSNRKELIAEAVGNRLSLRIDEMKYIKPVKRKNEAPFLIRKNIEGGFSVEPQLYDLSKDVGETNNIAAEHSELVTTMENKLQQIIKEGY